MTDDRHSFQGGLVSAPAFVAWRHQHDRWEAVYSADTRAECERRLDALYRGKGVVLPRGEHPADNGVGRINQSRA